MTGTCRIFAVKCRESLEFLEILCVLTDRIGSNKQHHWILEGPSVGLEHHVATRWPMRRRWMARDNDSNNASHVLVLRLS